MFGSLKGVNRISLLDKEILRANNILFTALYQYKAVNVLGIRSKTPTNGSFKELTTNTLSRYLQTRPRLNIELDYNLS